MTTVNVHEAKTHLSKLLERVESGESVTIARAGRPVAVLSPYRRPHIVFGSWEGKIVWDPETFDDVDPEIVAMFNGD